MRLAKMIVDGLAEWEREHPLTENARAARDDAAMDVWLDWQDAKIEVVQNIILEQLFGTPLAPRERP